MSKKPYKIEARWKPSIAKEIGSLFPDWLTGWTTYSSYKSEKDRDKALECLNRKAGNLEYREKENNAEKLPCPDCMTIGFIQDGWGRDIPCKRCNATGMI